MARLCQHRNKVRLIHHWNQQDWCFIVGSLQGRSEQLVIDLNCEIVGRISLGALINFKIKKYTYGYILFRHSNSNSTRESMAGV